MGCTHDEHVSVVFMSSGLIDVYVAWLRGEYGEIGIEEVALCQILQQELPCGLDLYANAVFDDLALFLFRHDDKPADGAV